MTTSSTDISRKLRDTEHELQRIITQLTHQLVRKRRELAKTQSQLANLSSANSADGIYAAMNYIPLFKKGEMGQEIISVLRVHGPKTNLEIARILMQQRGWDRRLWKTLRLRTRAGLSYLAGLGRITKTGQGMAAKWAIKPKLRLKIAA